MTSSWNFLKFLVQIAFRLLLPLDTALCYHIPLLISALYACCDRIRTNSITTYFNLHNKIILLNLRYFWGRIESLVPPKIVNDVSVIHIFCVTCQLIFRCDKECTNGAHFWANSPLIFVCRASDKNTQKKDNQLKKKALRKTWERSYFYSCDELTWEWRGTICLWRCDWSVVVAWARFPDRQAWVM